MKHFFLSFILLCLSLTSHSQLFSQKNLAIREGETENMMYAADSPAIIGRSPNGISEETLYVKENVSSVSVFKGEDKFYVNWNVCDDSSESFYVVFKTYDGSIHSVAGAIANIPCAPGFPILYGIVDSTGFVKNKNIFYKLYKITDQGLMVHIMTVIVPYYDAPRRKKNIVNMEIAKPYTYGKN